jgi:Kef-type K+ transport system membrane component KefB
MSITILYIAAAMTAGLLFNRFAKLISLPNVTGYLVAGLLIGPSVLNLIPKDGTEALNVLVTLALGFIAYSIGGEFNINNIKAIGGKSIIITMFQALTAVGLVDITLCALGFDVPLALTLGAIAAATAPAATLMVVRQYRANGPVTRTLLPVVAMDDAVGLIVFAVSLALAQGMSGGGDMSFYTMVVQPLTEIVLSLAIGGAIGLIASIALHFFHSKDNFLCVSVAAVLLGTALADIWGLSSLLLCMSIGAIVCNLRKDADSIMEGCERWTPPLFMLFFVISGAELDLAAIPTVGMLGVAYLVARSAGKYLGTYISSGIVHADDNIKKYLGLALLPQAGVAIGMAQVCAAKLPMYSERITTVVLCAALIYELIGPVITKAALVKAGEISPQFAYRRHKAAM